MRSRLLCLGLIAGLVIVAGCSDDDDVEDQPTPMMAAFDDGWGRIFMLNVDDMGLRQVTPPAGDGATDGNYANHAALSPDGTRLAYTRSGRFIEVVDLASGEATTVHEGGYQPAFSPDGSSIAFVSAGSGNIAIMNADGTDVRVISAEEFGSEPAFAPDGSRVIFNVAGYLVEAPATGGGASRTVVRDQFWNADPEYSPDGSTLLFSSNRGGKQRL